MRSVKTTCSEPKAMGAKGSEQGARRPFPQQATGSTKPVVMFASSLDSCLPKRQVVLRAWKILPGTKIEAYCSFQQLRTVASLRHKGALHHVRSIHQLSCRGKDSQVTLVSTDLVGNHQGKQDLFLTELTNVTSHTSLPVVAWWHGFFSCFNTVVFTQFLKGQGPHFREASTFLL